MMPTTITASIFQSVACVAATAPPATITGRSYLGSRLGSRSRWRRGSERDRRVQRLHGDDEAGATELLIDRVRIEHTISDVLAPLILISARPDIRRGQTFVRVAKAVVLFEQRHGAASRPVFPLRSVRRAFCQCIYRGFLECLERPPALRHTNRDSIPRIALSDAFAEILPGFAFVNDSDHKPRHASLCGNCLIARL